MQGIMKELYGDNFSQAAIDHMQVLDEQRVSAAIRKAHAKPESDIEAEAVTVLFETLSFADLLDDAEVINEMEQALLKLSKHHDLALTEGGRYPGVYKLLAHHNASLRALVSILYNKILNSSFMLHFVLYQRDQAISADLYLLESATFDLPVSELSYPSLTDCMLYAMPA